MNKHSHKLNDFTVFEKMVKDGVSIALAERTLKSVDPKGRLIKRHSLSGEIFNSQPKTPANNRKMIAEVVSLNNQSNNARMTRVVYLLELATKAFGNEKLAKKFLEKKHTALGETPLAKTDTEWGVRAVEKILNSMIYGLPA